MLKKAAGLANDRRGRLSHKAESATCTQWDRPLACLGPFSSLLVLSAPFRSPLTYSDRLLPLVAAPNAKSHFLTASRGRGRANTGRAAGTSANRGPTPPRAVSRRVPPGTGAIRQQAGCHCLGMTTWTAAPTAPQPALPRAPLYRPEAARVELPWQPTKPATPGWLSQTRPTAGRGSVSPGAESDCASTSSPYGRSRPLSSPRTDGSPPPRARKRPSDRAGPPG